MLPLMPALNKETNSALSNHDNFIYKLSIRSAFQFTIILFSADFNLITLNDTI